MNFLFLAMLILACFFKMFWLATVQSFVPKLFKFNQIKDFFTVFLKLDQFDFQKQHFYINFEIDDEDTRNKMKRVNEY